MGNNQSLLTSRINTIIGTLFLAVFAFGAFLVIRHAASGETSIAKALSVHFDDAQP